MNEQKKLFEISENMFSSNNKIKRINYIILKIGNKVYSTTFGQSPSKDIKISKHQTTHTKKIGTEDNFWIKGKFTEEENHTLLKEKIPFEINIYTETE